MSQPIHVDLPHQLGKTEARRRIADNIGTLEDHLPSGATVRHAWNEDRLNLSITAMGQEVDGFIDVTETLVRVEMRLPGMLGFFGKAIELAMREKGKDLLLEDRSD